MDDIRVTNDALQHTESVAKMHYVQPNIPELVRKWDKLYKLDDEQPPPVKDTSSSTSSSNSDQNNIEDVPFLVAVQKYTNHDSKRVSWASVKDELKSSQTPLKLQQRNRLLVAKESRKRKREHISK